MNFASFTGIYDPLAIATASRQLLQQNVPALRSANGLGVTENEAALAGGVLTGAVIGILVGVLVLRGAMGWYVGKQFGRGTSGAIMGGLFGAPGLGVVSLFGRGK